MSNRCIYCGTKIGFAGMCGHCSQKLRLIRQIKEMLLPYYNSKKEREQKLNREDGYGYYKNLHEYKM